MEIERAWKVLRPDLTSYKGCQWVPGEWKKVEGTGPLCSEGWLHGYRDARLAVLHNPIHANYDPYVLWIAEVKGKVLHENYMKSGWSEMRLIEPVAVPAITMEQRIRYAIKCAWCVCNNPVWRDWAVDWIREENRSRQRAEQVWRVMWVEAAWAAVAAAGAATGAAAAAAEAAVAAGAEDLLQAVEWAMSDSKELR